MPDFADVTASVVPLTRIGHETVSRFREAWGLSQDAALSRVKETFSSPPILKFPDFDREFVVHVVDASEEVVGKFLT